MDYIMNLRSGLLHKLPASESCNTDQIVRSKRFILHPDEIVVAAYKGRLCHRCFGVS